MKTKEASKLVDDYIRGEMSVEEREQFERKLSEDPGLREAYELQKNINRALDDEEFIQYKKLLNEIHREKRVKHPLNFQRTKRIYAIAALIVVLLAVGSILLFQLLRPEHERLFRKYYTSYAFEQFRSFEENKLQEGILFYQEGQYEQAIRFSKSYITNHTGDVQANFLLAISLMEEGKYNEAVHYFSRVIKSDHLRLREYAEWYEALATLHQGKIERASLLLSRIKIEENNFSEKAQEILIALEE
ncbi:MAG: hypothetical protein K9G58_00175 [Bacteroidales bacterium]|nr:hypothetical protein [Bacteroidales bacterium]MCF8386867.1 hypothetical protein [Bacteroidales bacterium]MCF8396554.1 hypothetical protein [Bacteroidales bacterium]